MLVNDTPLNILASYAYCGGKNRSFLDSCVRMAQEGKANLMLDSGAFTAFNAKSNFAHVNLKDYIDFCGTYGDFFEKYVMLDVLGNREKTIENYHEMLRQGLRPMFVVTMYDKDFGFVKETLQNCEHICVAAGGYKNDWALKRYQDIYRATDGKCKTHALGFVTFPRMLQLPLASCDSSTWNYNPAKYGGINWFTSEGLKAARLPQFKQGKPVPLELRKQLEFCGITPKVFFDASNHRGSGSCAILLSIVANMQMQKYCYARGLRFFLAVGSKGQLDQIEYVADNFYNLDYSKFRNL